MAKIPSIELPTKGGLGLSALTSAPPRARKSLQYRALLEAAPDAIVVVNRSGLIVLVNAQAEKLFGYRRSELIGQPADILVSEHSRDQHTEHHSRFLAPPPDRPTVVGLELFGLRKDGSEFPAEIRLSPLDTKEGVLVSSAIRDISDRRRTEEDLRRLAAIVAFSDDAIVGKTMEGIITSWNVGAERIFGYTPKEAIGQPVTMLVPADRPDEVPRMLESLKRGETVEHFETVRVRKDGKEVQIEVTVSPIRDALERIVGASTIGRDISVRKAAEKHLVQMEARYRGLLEAAPDAMVVVNQAGEIVLLNLQAEKQFGYRRDELIGQRVKNIIPEGFAERLIADALRSAAEALAQQIGTGIELNGRRKNGSDFPIEIMLSPLESSEGTLVTAAIRDISVRKAAEQHLAQMEGRYRGLLEAAPDAMVVVNRGGEIVLLNVQAERQFGYRRDELIGQKVKNIIPQGFAERLIADGTRSAAEALAQQIGTGIELTGRRKDGSDFPIEIMLSPLESSEGTLVTAAIRDISVRKAAEQHLAQMEGRYRGLLEAAPDAMVVVNQGGEIVLLNVQAERQFGYRRDELIGQKVKNIIPQGFAERLIADGTRSAAEALAQQIGTGIELTGRRKDGSDFPIELMLSPLDGADGILVTAAIRDITERKRRAHDMSILAAVVESSHDAIISLTPEGIVLSWNHGAERIYGYSAAETLSRSILFISPPDRAEETLALLKGVKSGEPLEPFETIHVKKDGTRIHVSLTLSPIENSDGEVVGVSAVARDVTENKNMEAMLRQAQKMEAVGQLAGGVAHDFNNLLGVILGYTGLMLEHLSPADSNRKGIEEIQKAGERAALLTRQLLAFSRKQVLQPKILDLNNVVTGTEKLLQRLIGEHIDLQVVLNPALGLVKADAGQLEQIIMNLAVNARDAMPPGGKLTIETSNVEIDEDYALQHPSTRAGPHVMLSVTDTGCGMDADTKAHMFEPFFTTKEFGKGTGLGLSTVYGIVKQSGGSVWVYSEVGIGTTFKIYLPCVSPVLETVAPGEKPEKIEGGQQTILVVEDEVPLLEVTHRSLEAFGYVILAANGPEEAMQISASHPGPIHLMVTDVIMPGMSGAQLASRLSASRPEMKVLYVSGYTDDTIVRHGVLDAGLAFLQKPFSPRTLARKVEEILTVALV